MITCSGDSSTGVMTISGSTPNGNATITRNVTGLSPYLLRDGAKKITTNGFLIFDTEAPFVLPLTYVATVTGISAADRLVQQNLMLTPTFTHGLFGWAAGPGAGRAASTVSDAASHSGTVGLFSGTTATAVTPGAPTLIGHIDTPVFGVFNYSLTPPTTGGTAIATNDFMVWVHQQLSSVAAPATPAGWALVDDTTDGTIRQIVWSHARTAAEQTAGASYTVTTGGGAQNIATILWVRNATLDAVIPSITLIAGGTKNTLSTASAPVTDPHLTISVFSAVTASAQTAPVAVSGLTYQYTRNSGTNPRTMLIASESNDQSGMTATGTVTYGDLVMDAAALSISFPRALNFTNRVIAKAKAALLPAAAQPYLLTGRFRFTTVDLNLWQDLKNIGTWQQVKTAKATWLAARGNASTSTGDFLKLFVAIVNPATGAFYTPAVQIMDSGEAAVNTWVDFSALFSVPAAIPATAEIWLFHGTNVREYAVNWYLDEFGITPGAQFFNKEPLYWFDGDSPLPEQPGFNMMPDGAWTATTQDASMSWSGTVGNSVSVYTGPSGLTTSSTCVLDLPDRIPCEPVFLSDPVNSALGAWAGLIGISDLTHPAKQAIYQVLNRAASVANSQVRGWETGTIQVLTDSLAERNQLMTVFASGRILLIRNPDPAFPEDGWYLACGDLKESRPIPNQRVPVREWEFDFVRVERPTGLIAASVPSSWQSVKDLGLWSDVQTLRPTWLDVLTGVQS